MLGNEGESLCSLKDWIRVTTFQWIVKMMTLIIRIRIKPSIFES